MIAAYTFRDLFRLAVVNLVLLASSVQAQQADINPVEDADLRACLVLEQEGIQRFKKLETAANDLRGIENALNSQRVALQNQQNKLKDNKSSAEAKAKAVAAFNASINDFNQRADQLNADKGKFESNVAAYDHWMNNTLKPVCEKVANKS